ncbi:hypothetical protein GCM10007304_44500 [Rhodococcoides trifolii]|uniref:ANTAR domain-containing protein n=1 Tax=Rhodococcoides trifolii TaxID=908250 RepID=A0A917G6V9_9NOCA|nr:GAF and ANTAR domain-containing protein [Rhodococcus trifolii]GGG25760.1 hypothetical protein GCM10007304_44500 [Rhodococcus trifolii]
MSTYGDLGREMAALARSLTFLRSIDGRASAVTASAVSIIGGVACADVMMVDQNRIVSVAATDPLTIELDRVQQDSGHGPCLDAVKSERVVRSDDLRTEPRWPAFSSAAVAVGVHSMLSLRLYVGTESIGALNLFGLSPNAFDSDDEGIGLLLATHAAIALSDVRKVEQFQLALLRRDTIGQAKGIVMERYSVDAERAFQMLAKISQDTNVTVFTVSTRVIETSNEGGGAPWRR